MKPHHELTTEILLQEVLAKAAKDSGTVRRHQPSHEGDPFDRAPDASELEEAAHLHELIAEKGEAVFRTLCIGCENDVPMKEAAMCECGGFVCQDCRAREEEGVCNHEPPDPDALID